MDAASASRELAGIGLLGWAAAIAISAALVLWLRPHLHRLVPAVSNHRSSHRGVVPQGGGIAVMLAAVPVSLALALFAGPADMVRLGVAMLGAALLCVVGAYDDARGLSISGRLGAQAIAAILVISALPSELRVLSAIPHWLERALLLLALLWMVNLVNFMDGIDWMVVAAMVPLTAGAMIIGWLGALPREGLIAALALNGAILGFAPFNRPVARIFLGDSGSLPIGLLAGWLLALIAAGGHLAAAILLPLYFVADATLTLIKRQRAGKRLSDAHRDHFYQRAVDAGAGVPWIISRVFAVNVALAGLAVLTVVASAPRVVFPALMTGFALVAWLLQALTRRAQHHL